MQQTTIDWGNGPPAVVVTPALQATGPDVLRALALPPHQAVLAVIGAANGLDDSLLPKLTQFFNLAVARAAHEAGAILLDGGTQAGVMALLGAGVASRGYQSALLGVAPASLVAYPGGPAAGVPLEPHHSHFVLAPGTKWGCETNLFFQLLQALATPSSPVGGGVPALVLLVGGGPTTLAEVVQAVRQQRLVLVLAGSGGLADELAAAWPTREAALPDDPDLAEVLADGALQFYPLSGSVPGLERLLVRELGANLVLQQAWETFADYDANANAQQRTFDRLQRALLGLGLVGTALAIGQQLYAPKELGTSTLLPAPALWQAGQTGWWVLHHALILLPIVLTVLVTAISRFKPGTKWLLLRAGAEAIKREIYRYRARAQAYADQPDPCLAQRVEEITRRTMRTEVNASSLVPYDKRRGFPPGLGTTQAGDDGLGFLTPARYVVVRLGHQLAYFQQKAVRLERQLRVLSWLTFGAGGLGTYLAAVGQQVWLALTTALVTALGTYLGYRQTESTLTKYNQAATDLANVRAWWHALSPEQQAQPASLDLLVAHTEQVLQTEHEGWVQHMQNALADLHKTPPAEAPPAAEAAAAPDPAAAAAPPPAPTLASRAPLAAPAAAPPASPPAAEAASADELTADAELPTEDTADEAPSEADLETADAAPAPPRVASPVRRP